MKKSLRSAIALASVLTVGLLTTACQSDDSADSTPPKAAGTQQKTQEAGDTGSAPAADQGGGKDGGAQSDAGGKDSNKDDGKDGATQQGAGGKDGYGQACGTNDLSWKVTPKSQAGGYDEISVRAKSGITCVLPAGIPVVAFGSGGIEAGPAEQSAGRPITLSGTKTAYAGVTPKSVNANNGVEFSSMIVSVSTGDPNPVSLPVDGVEVNEPLVSSWHTDPAKAVPLS
ncbi:DUF4232 domain-containing protein [Streptomyces sp. NPDC048057]|uniref:DUF4232 domain-containing protein n=1 Tax=Streptomyces sp. NPDC048057 TaxID=3155628 RepID=UPI0033D18BED